MSFGLFSDVTHIPVHALQTNNKNDKYHVYNQSNTTYNNTKSNTIISASNLSNYNNNKINNTNNKKFSLIDFINNKSDTLERYKRGKRSPLKEENYLFYYCYFIMLLLKLNLYHNLPQWEQHKY